MVAFTAVEPSLPVLGVGASLSFGVPPDPVALAEHPRGPSFIEYAGAVDVTPLWPAVSRLHARKVPTLFHPSCLNLAGTVANPQGWLERMADHVARVRSPWLAQDVALCFAGAPGYSIQLGWFVPPLYTAASLDVAVARVHEVKAALAARPDSRVPLLLEPAPLTFIAGDIHPLAWLQSLAERTDCGLLVDCGHVVSVQLAHGDGHDRAAGLDALDLARVMEVHVAGGHLHRLEDGSARYIDAHELPIQPEAWQVFRILLERCPRLRAVCVECEGMPAAAVQAALEAVRTRVVQGAAHEALRAAAERELARGSAR